MCKLVDVVYDAGNVGTLPVALMIALIVVLQKVQVYGYCLLGATSLCLRLFQQLL